MPTVITDDGMLEQALHDLKAAWVATESDWQDQARHDFADQHLEPIDTRARQAMRAMRQMETLLSEAARQCT
jgi:hypothetical protein